MQSNKADEAVRRDLRQWLENPDTHAGAGASEAREDLAWLEKSKDLSSVNLGNPEKPASIKPEVGKEASLSGFSSWFNQCTGKRQ